MTESAIVFDLTDDTEQSEFEQLLRGWEDSFGVKIIQKELGADRTQWICQYHEALFVVFHEDLSEVAWIEVMKADASSQLVELYNLIKKSC